MYGHLCATYCSLPPVKQVELTKENKALVRLQNYLIHQYKNHSSLGLKGENNIFVKSVVQND
jgi:hypothetical protein